MINIPRASIEPFGVIGFPKPLDDRVFPMKRSKERRVFYPYIPFTKSNTESFNTIYEDFVRDIKEILENDDT